MSDPNDIPTLATAAVIFWAIYLTPKAAHALRERRRRRGNNK